MKQYKDLMRDVLANGTKKEDRTGTGTISIFGHQSRYDLSEGFPLLTTKKMFTRGMIEELLWIIRGSTNEHELRDKDVNFWRQWARDNGELGAIYGYQLRRASSVYAVERLTAVKHGELIGLEPLFVEGSVRNMNARNTYGVGYMGAYDSLDPHYNMLVETWRSMIRRCYDETSKTWDGYGGAGIHVDESWHCFAQFQKDAKKLRNWEMKVEYHSEFSLDKDCLRASNVYRRDTAMWASDIMQNANRCNTNPFTAISPEGNTEVFSSIGRMSREHNLNVSAIHRCLEGQLHTHHGWSEFARIEAPEGLVIRYSEVDQIKQLIATLKHNPDSRRHVISLWNPADIIFAELPPCHGVVIQFYISNGKLSCLMHQRSGDIFLGVPVNIASYSLLLMMMAQVTGLEAGEFIHTIGDAHIYSNHVEQCKLQLSRAERPLPTMTLNPDIKDIFDFKYEDFTLSNYNPHPSIKGEVAV